jgi:hypothetical protein
MYLTRPWYLIFRKCTSGRTIIMRMGVPHTLYTIHNTQYTIRSTLYATHYTLCTIRHTPQPDSRLEPSPGVLYIVHYALYTIRLNGSRLERRLGTKQTPRPQTLNYRQIRGLDGDSRRNKVVDTRRGCLVYEQVPDRQSMLSRICKGAGELSPDPSTDALRAACCTSRHEASARTKSREAFTKPRERVHAILPQHP